VRPKRAQKIEELHEAFAAYRSLPQELDYIAPQSPIVVRDEPDRPQPKAVIEMQVRG
jgi:hypothetical protein